MEAMTNSSLEALRKAATLTEALPWMRRFHGSIFVIKLGGNAMGDSELMQSFADDMVFLATVGVKPVVVHGGGPQITEALEAKGIPSEFRGGYRVTSTAAIPVVRDVLRNTISAAVAERINRHSDLAIVLSGEDENLFVATKRGAVVDGVSVDLGYVGDVVQVNPGVIHDLLDAGKIPVVSSVAPGDDGASLLNVNADSAAAALAIALGAEKMVLLTDVQGLYRNWPDTESLISSLTLAALEGLLPSLESGMIPKMTACLDAVRGGVAKAAIIDGRLAHSVLLEAFTAEGIGTEVVAS
ncbi:MAG: acetylglutamate kinase [Pontimonas sp.]|nr:MAG: acetylglutamate kinase [actinobacterium acMicro-4]MCF8522535.1 acetylglutamate kinase [Pontimonas sp.]MCF8547655.1 acetylglutamate kinase [Pontimonas sp.]